jgi:hypothetical protein
MLSGGQQIIGQIPTPAPTPAPDAPATPAAAPAPHPHVGGGGGGNAAKNQQISALSDQTDAQQDALANLNNALEQAQTELSKIGGDEGYARSRAEQAKNLVDSIEKQIDDYKQQIDSGWRDWEVQQGNVARAWDMTYFYQDMFEREFENDQIQAGLEAFFQSINNGMEAFRAALASFFNFGSAIIGSYSGGASIKVDATFRPFSYLQAQAPEQNKAIESAAQAQSQQANLDKQAANLNEKDNDPFLNDKLAEARSERSAADADQATQDAAEATARASYESMRTEVQQAQAMLRQTYADIRKLQTPTT